MDKNVKQKEKKIHRDKMGKTNVSKPSKEAVKVRRRRTHWGEFAGMRVPKVEVSDCYSIFPPEKKQRLERLALLDEPTSDKWYVLNTKFI